MGCPSCLRLGRQDHRLHHPSRGRLQRIGVDMTKEALKLALEALEPIPYKDDWTVAKETNKAITAIKEALKQPEPNYKKALEVWLDKTEWVQETVKPHELGMHRADVLKQRIEEASPQRTWVTLTEDEIVLISADCAATHQHTDIHFAKAIEAKLKEKNNG